MPPRLVEGGTLVFDVDDVIVQLPGEIKYGAFGVRESAKY